MAERGRPTKYSPEFCEVAHELCLLGMNNDELSAYFDVDPSTIDLWIATHPEFSGSIVEGREIADANVSKSLYKRALGYVDKDGKEIPPDTRAIEWWLRNRQRASGRWKEKQEIEVTGDADALTARLLAARKKNKTDDDAK